MYSELVADEVSWHLWVLTEGLVLASNSNLFEDLTADEIDSALYGYWYDKIR